MKIKLLIILQLFAFLKAETICAQKDTIRGKIFSSVSRQKPKGDIYIFEKGTSNKTIANQNGEFKLIPKTSRKIYELEISVGNYPKLLYEYKAIWNKRKNPKSIVVIAPCEINKEKARKDWKNGTPKLYINSGITPVENSRKDKRFEKKYNVEYIELGGEAKIYECICEYNFYIIKILDILYRREWRKTKREEIVGMEDYKNSIRPSLR